VTSLIQQIENFIRHPQSGDFECLARRAFAFQYEQIEPYRRLADRQGISPQSITDWREIPPVPVLAFKTLKLHAAPALEVFRSSGTTGKRSVHHHPFPHLYRMVIDATFPTWCLPPRGPLHGRPSMLALIPPRAQQPDSSLGFMVDHVLRHHGAPDTNAYAFGPQGVDVNMANTWCRERRKEGSPVLVLATSFALAHWLQVLEATETSCPLPAGSTVFDTGGFKGQTREISRERLLQHIAKHLNVPPERVVREYGMTELTSQFYTPNLTGGGQQLFVGPPWLKARLLDPITLREVPPGTPGIVSVFDLANLGSAVHILTQDLGIAVDGGFELLGRASDSELRGCSLTVEELTQGV
jgi:hypothetical protein